MLHALRGWRVGVCAGCRRGRCELFAKAALLEWQRMSRLYASVFACCVVASCGCALSALLLLRCFAESSSTATKLLQQWERRTPSQARPRRRSHKTAKPRPPPRLLRARERRASNSEHLLRQQNGLTSHTRCSALVGRARHYSRRRERGPF